MIVYQQNDHWLHSNVQQDLQSFHRKNVPFYQNQQLTICFHRVRILHNLRIWCVPFEKEIIKKNIFFENVKDKP
jgi:hypothetical protein